MINKPIHISFVIHNAVPVPYFNWFAEKAIHDKRFKFSFIFLNENNEQVEKVMVQWNASVYWIPFSNANKKKSMIVATWKLYKLFRKLKPDISHSHLFYDGVVALNAAKWAGIKIRVHTKQSTGFNWYYAPKAVRFDRMKDRLATHLIAVSNECRTFLLEKEKADPKKIKLIHHGIDPVESVLSTPEQRNQIREKYNPQNKKVVMMVARYIEWKGYRYFIEAAKKVVTKYPDVIFWGIGTGPQEAELRGLIQKHELEKYFLLTGFIERNLIPSCYQSADVYVHAALREPFGFVIAEAMMNALPLVTTRTGAAADGVEHLKSGYLVDDESADQLADGILYILNKSDAERKEMGANAAKRAMELFSFEKMWKGYTDLYLNAMEERSAK